MRVAVTGVGTILGRPLVLRLAAAGHDVVAAYRTANAWLDGLEGRKGISLVQADLAQADGAERAVPAATEVVLHLAATSAGPGISVEKLIRDNVEATRNLALAAAKRKIARFVYMSSMSVHGEVSHPVVGATTAIVNPSPYGTTKRLGEQAIQDMSAAFSSVSLRLPALVGRGAHRHWLAKLVETARAGGDISIFNPDAPFNNAVHVDEIVGFLSQLAEMPFSGAEAFPLASTGTLPIRDVVRRIVHGLSSPSRIDEKKSGAQSFIIDHSVAVASYGYTPAAIESVLERYIAESR